MKNHEAAFIATTTNRVLTSLGGLRPAKYTVARHNSFLLCGLYV
jgi:hypothetical protein